ncbi:predicted protein [Uncinocarpus reesii 1704]|uniref:Tetraspanin n=1 Tax=Uncinocarpus reesii (strain UAMH 1704) TaxID=336963 RepID=C4JPC6_UNCRE|nr:uncharacterized protein UREG_04508 [Uncinocarpus reesii 1704]EEP79662.1 predicted protein [Uncinocarpus reesii 1704]
MPDKLLIAYIIADALFLGGGAAMLAVALTSRDKIQSAPTLDNVAERLLLSHCPQLGLIIWFLTLRTRSTLNVAWGNETPEVQSLLQQRFNCCGYLNSTSPPYQVDSTCPTDLDAAQKQGCVGPFSNFANSFLDVIFTADFGIVAIDAVLLLCIAMVLKDRKERARYRLIDAKNGFGTI